MRAGLQSPTAGLTEATLGNARAMERVERQIGLLIEHHLKE